MDENPEDRWTIASSNMLSSLGQYEVYGQKWPKSCEPIEDSGAMVSSGSLPKLMTLAEYMNHDFTLLPLHHKQCRYHHFGPANAKARIHNFIGNCRLPIPTLEGNRLYVTFEVFRESSPVIIGRDLFDKNELRIITYSHKNIWKLKIKGQRNTIRTYLDPDIGNLRRVSVRFDVQDPSTVRSLIKMKPSITNESILKNVHDRTHSSPEDIRRLLQRTGMWESSLSKLLLDIREKCITCAKTSEFRRATKYSIRNIDAHFNHIVDVDFFQFKQNGYFMLYVKARGTRRLA